MIPLSLPWLVVFLPSPVIHAEPTGDSPVVMMGRFESIVPPVPTHNDRSAQRNLGQFKLFEGTARASERPTCAQFGGKNWRCVGSLHSDSIHLFEGGGKLMAQLIIQQAKARPNATISANTYYDHGPTGGTREYGRLTFHDGHTENAGNASSKSELFYYGHGSSLVTGETASGLSFGGRIHRGTGVFKGMIGEIVYVQRYLAHPDSLGNTKCWTYYIVLLDYEEKLKAKKKQQQWSQAQEWASRALKSEHHDKQSTTPTTLTSKPMFSTESKPSLFTASAQGRNTAVMQAPKVIMGIISGACTEPSVADGSFECQMEARPENLTTTISAPSKRHEPADVVNFRFAEDTKSPPVLKWNLRLHASPNETMYGVPLWIEDGLVDFGGNTTLAYRGMLPGGTMRTMHGVAHATTGALAGKQAVVVGCVNQDASEGYYGHVAIAIL